MNVPCPPVCGVGCFCTDGHVRGNDGNCVPTTQCTGTLAGLGEKCEGWDEWTGKYFPSCEEGLVCESTPGMISISGAGKTCKRKLAGLGEKCEGWDEWTGKYFPSCE